jgi:hypothetical protein
MIDRNERADEMPGGRLDLDTLDRLLDGAVDPDDAPPGYSEVARLLHVVAQGGDHEELVHEAAHVALAVELVQQRSPVSLAAYRKPSGREKTARSRTHRGKIGGLVVVGAMVGSTGLAAAGVLPDGAQDAFSHVFEKIGITVPAGANHPASSGEELSGIATTTDATGVSKGAEISSVASGGRSKAGKHGFVAGGTPAGGLGPPVHGPNGRGTGTADAVSNGKSRHGTSTAHAASQGRSSAGSANADVAHPVHVSPSKPPAHARPGA